MTRAVVIGAGHNGLVCAAHLASAGVEVTVLEQSEAGYGGTTTQEGPMPGFRHDVCAGFFPLTLAAPAFRALGLEHEVEWIAADTVMAHPFEDGRALALYRDIERTADGLGPAGAAYAPFITRLVDNYRDLMDAALAPPPPGAAALKALGGLRADALKLVWRSLLPAGMVGRRWLGNERAAAWLAGSTAHSDLDPTSPGGGAFALTLKMLGHAVGWPFPRGGAQAIAEALRRRLEAAGGHVRHGATVEEILVARGGGRGVPAAHGRERGVPAGGRVLGVRLAGGERLDADAVISTVTAKPFIDLVPARTLPWSLARRLRNWKHDLGVFKVDFALDRPVPWTAAECREAGTVHVGPGLGDFVASFRAGRDGVFPQRPALVVGQHTLFDQSRVPEGKHVLYAYMRSPLSQPIPVDQGADLIEEQIERFAPGFRATVLGRTVRAPEQMQAHNPSMIGGDLGGGSYQLHHQFVLRPHPYAWRTRTPIDGLYFAGASAHPGGGVHGTQGYEAARFVLDGRR